MRIKRILLFIIAILLLFVFGCSNEISENDNSSSSTDIYEGLLGYRYDRKSKIGIVEGENIVSLETYENIEEKLVLPTVFSDGTRITSVGDHSFNNNTIITDLTIPDGYEYIGHMTFANCVNLENVNIGKDVFYVGENAFSGCNNIKSFNVSEGNIHLYVRDNCLLTTSDNELVASTGAIPVGTKKIGHSVFGDSTRISNVIVPQGVKQIGGYAFRDSSIEAIFIPDSVTTILRGAFQGTKLKEIYIPESVTTIGDDLFYMIDGITINCEAESKPEGWDDNWLYGCENYTLNWGVKDNASNDNVSNDNVSNENGGDSNIPKTPIVKETNNQKTVIDMGGVGSTDIPYYSRFGSNIYILLEDENGNIGTKKITNGVTVAFYPNAYNVVEKDGFVYGMIADDGCSCCSDRAYCRLNEDGTHDVIIDCWQVFYFDDKIYYYDSVLDEGDDQYHLYVFSADIDGENITIVSDEVTGMPTYPSIIKYDEHLVYSDFIGGICAKTPDGTKVDLYSNYSAMTKIQFINNNYVYYTSFYSRSTMTFSAVYHSLWRVDLNGENRECIIEKQRYNSFDFNATCFGDKMIVFAPDKITVYNSDFSLYEEYDYSLIGFDDIEQVCVLDDTLSISGWVDNKETFKNVIYDLSGNIVFETN